MHVKSFNNVHIEHQNNLRDLNHVMVVGLIISQARSRVYTKWCGKQKTPVSIRCVDESGSEESDHGEKKSVSEGKKKKKHTGFLSYQPRTGIWDSQMIILLFYSN